MTLQSPSDHATRTGMALLELLIALVVTGMALAAGYAAFTTIIDRRMQVNTAMTGVVRAATVRRTLVDWLQRGMVQLPAGSDIPGNISSFQIGSSSDELRFTTTAPTALRRDSTVVELYVERSNVSGLSYPGEPSGLVAFLEPTASALQSMDSANAGDMSPFSGFGSSGSSSFGPNSGSNSPGFSSSSDYFYSDSKVVSLDPSVTGMRVEYLLVQGDSAQVWVSSSSIAEPHAGGATVVAVRLTLLSDNAVPLNPILNLPIVVPVLVKL